MIPTSKIVHINPLPPTETMLRATKVTSAKALSDTHTDIETGVVMITSTDILDAIERRRGTTTGIPIMNHSPKPPLKQFTKDVRNLFGAVKEILSPNKSGSKILTPSARSSKLQREQFVAAELAEMKANIERDTLRMDAYAQSPWYKKALEYKKQMDGIDAKLAMIPLDRLKTDLLKLMEEKRALKLKDELVFLQKQAFEEDCASFEKYKQEYALKSQKPTKK